MSENLNHTATLIITWYLFREILKPQIVVCAFLVAIFVSYSSARYLADAVTGLLPASTTVVLILLKALIALEVLLPITLFLSVMLALSRLYSDSEMTALGACGVSPVRVLGVVLGFSLVIASLVAILSLVVRPWAYEHSYWIRAQADIQIDLKGLEPGTFYEKQGGDVVIFVEGYDAEHDEMTGVFFQRLKGDQLRVIYAKRGYVQQDSVTGREVPVLLNGQEYQLTWDGSLDRVATFKKLVIQLEQKEKIPGYKRKAAPTWQLAQSSRPKDIAEWQWRLSTPLSTVLLGLLAVPLSRTVPRQGKYAKIFWGILIYAVYYNLQEIAKIWVKQGIMPAIPGIWWVDVLLAGVLLALLWKPFLKYSLKQERVS